MKKICLKTTYLILSPLKRKTIIKNQPPANIYALFILYEYKEIDMRVIVSFFSILFKKFLHVYRYGMGTNCGGEKGKASGFVVTYRNIPMGV